MRVIDARTGKEIKVGDVISGAPGEMWKVKRINSGILFASIDLESVWSLGEIKATWPLTVRWLHPDFLFQHVAFLNS